MMARSQRKSAVATPATHGLWGAMQGLDANGGLFLGVDDSALGRPWRARLDQAGEARRFWRSRSNTG